MRGSRRETTLILVRHGETTANVEARVQGHQDSPLTAEGVAQAQRIAGRLKRMELAAVYSSDAGRARETAATIAAPHGLEVRCRADLRERCYGALEGLTLEEAEEREGDWLQYWLSDRQHVAPPGGETEPEMCRRVMAALREIAAAHLGEMAAVCTHGGPIKAAVFEILGIGLGRWGLAFIANGSITILRGGPELLRVVCFNDTCHLEGELSEERAIED